MKKWGLMKRLKIALWDFYSGDLWENWSLKKSKDKTLIEDFHEECNLILRNIPKAQRELFTMFLEKKAIFLIREGTQFLDSEKSLINKARLFQTILIKQSIERVTKKEEEEKEQAEKIAKKKLKK